MIKYAFGLSPRKFISLLYFVFFQAIGKNIKESRLKNSASLLGIVFKLSGSVISNNPENNSH